jgi:hypothetical protein
LSPLNSNRNDYPQQAIVNFGPGVMQIRSVWQDDFTIEVSRPALWPVPSGFWSSLRSVLALNNQQVADGFNFYVLRREAGQFGRNDEVAAVLSDFDRRNTPLSAEVAAPSVGHPRFSKKRVRVLPHRKRVH